MNMDKTNKLTFVPSYKVDSLKQQVAYSNNSLAKLQEYVTDFGETWADVLEYAEKGAEFKKEARLAECRAWMDKNKTPSYLRPTMEAEAIADLGENNLEYWAGLPYFLQIRTYNTTSAPLLNLKTDVDASGDAWQVSPAWMERQKAAIVVVVPDHVADDFKRFNELTKVLADFGTLGYNTHELARHIKTLADYNSLENGINVETWYNSYSAASDGRMTQTEK